MPIWQLKGTQVIPRDDGGVDIEQERGPGDTETIYLQEEELPLFVALLLEAAEESGANMGDLLGVTQRHAQSQADRDGHVRE